MSDYTLRRLQTREQLDAVVEVIFKAQYSPYMPSSSIFFPVAGYSLEERSAGVAASKERLWKEHLAANPATNHWIIVEEKESLKIVGGCLWKWHDGNQFPDGIPTPSVYWWPEGEAREFCEEMIRQSMTPRSLWMHDRNAGLYMMVVHPDHRSRGVGGLMMEWANTRIDEMGIEGFIEANELGRHLYEKWGYRVVMKLDLFIPSNKSDLWNKLAHDLKMPPWYAMWRPLNGIVQEGERTRPWQPL
ncbi:uncharacterized protein EAE98_004152 [Botrytis deweyae]|uniref:N-acetyltransferase domain-containing protein n=1 Tax=Botrytis deweyae TaxID=2478750 RepID=A0ABQ7ISS1_9HELO|nr:uncharacterized protein EAE98_004152 [Botrytis deweyae]KAF7932853.1 hypothetical protein EAE98_004152 [Botrytis deweyae]